MGIVECKLFGILDFLFQLAERKLKFTTGTCVQADAYIEFDRGHTKLNEKAVRRKIQSLLKKKKSNLWSDNKTGRKRSSFKKS